MYRVLLPVDDDDARVRAQVEAVLERPTPAGEIAVDILHVHDEAAAPNAGWAAGGGFSETYAEEMAEQVRDVDRLESADVEFAVHERSGEPATEILAFAAERDSDVIVLGVDGRTPVGKVLFGSVVQAVILESDRPITVVPRASES